MTSGASRPTSRERSPRRATARPRAEAMVVRPTPPMRFQTAITRSPETLAIPWVRVAQDIGAAIVRRSARASP